MFAGHLAVALGAKKLKPDVPLGASVAAAFGLDLIWPIFLLLGLEVVRVNPGDTAFTNLAFDSYPWSHSLLLVLGWSCLGVVAGRILFKNWGSGLLIGALVLSHWCLDFITHRPDLPLWPGGPVHGLGLWASIPATLLFEGALLAACLWLYLGTSPAGDRIGRWALVGLVGLTVLLWGTQPWQPLPPSAQAVAMGALVLWIMPPWANWIERHRGGRQKRSSS